MIYEAAIIGALVGLWMSQIFFAFEINKLNRRIDKIYEYLQQFYK